MIGKPFIVVTGMPRRYVRRVMDIIQPSGEAEGHPRAEEFARAFYEQQPC